MKKRSIQAINLGAGGHASDMIGRLRMNNSALRRNKYFEKAKSELVFASSQAGITLETAAEEQLILIRQQVMENRKTARMKILWSVIIAVPLAVLIILGLWQLTIYMISNTYH